MLLRAPFQLEIDPADDVSIWLYHDPYLRRRQ